MNVIIFVITFSFKTATKLQYLAYLADRLSAWLILLPLYLLFMIPWTLLLILYRQVILPIKTRDQIDHPEEEKNHHSLSVQVVVWLKLAKETQGEKRHSHHNHDYHRHICLEYPHHKVVQEWSRTVTRSGRLPALDSSGALAKVFPTSASRSFFSASLLLLLVASRPLLPGW